LINQFKKILDKDNTLEFDFRSNIIWQLERKLDNKIDELFDKKIKEQEKELVN
jgi:hypothetical protein